MKRITGRLAEDKGKYYAVINLPNTDGKRKTKWHTQIGRASCRERV